MSAAGPGADLLDRSQPPPAGKLRPFDFPPFERWRLANGLEVLAARTTRVPLVDVEVLLPAGGQHCPAELPGLANLHAELLDEGSARHSALEVAARAEALGGALSSGAGWNVGYVETGLLSRHLAEGLELLAEGVRAAGFEAGEIERLRHEQQAEILRRRDQPAYLAERAFSAAVYGETVYGRPLLGTEDSLASITRDHLLDFYERHAVPGGSTLIAVGDVDLDELRARVEERFGDWPRRSAPARPEIAPVALEHSRVILVDRPGAAQTQLQIGHAAVPRSHPDFPALILLNAILGGKFTSRINLNLRERHGYTYGAQSYIVRRQGPGPFMVRTAVGNEVAGAAAGEVVDEIRRLCEDPVGEEELRETRDYLVGVFPYTVQTVGDLVKRLEALAIFDLADDYYDRYAEMLSAPGREDLLAAARRHFHPDRLAIVAAGPADQLRPQFESLGPVEVCSP